MIKPGHTSLNMADISDDLSVVHRHVRKLEVSKRQGGDINNPVLPQFQKDIQKADDTDLVAGVAANKVAVAESTADRTTIRNARLHDGHAWSEVMTKKEGDGLTGRTNTAISNYSKDIKELRDEVYQLRMELAKSGVAVGYKPYAGFYDMFREHQPMHEANVMATAIDNSPTQYKIKIEDTAFDKFYAGDKILIKSLVNGETALVGIQTKEPDGRTLTLDRATGFNILKGKAVVYKSKGSLINGTFTFGEITPERPGKKEMYTCLDDDTFRVRRRISKKKTGFAYTFRIAETLQKNYLAKLDVQVKKFGNPGALMCYIIDERDMPRWKNAAQAIADNDANSPDYGTTKYNFFAKSQPLIVDASKGEHLAHFTFYDPTAGELVPVAAADLSAAEYAALTADEQAALAANGKIMKRNQSSYPLMREVDSTDHKIRYCMIIEALSADNNNYYDFVFLQNKNEVGEFVDLQLNNKTYNYQERETTSTDDALVTNKSINSADLYYGITLIEAVHEAFTPYDDGVYSAHFELHEPVEVNKARLMLRIAREGMFKVNASGSSTIGDMGNGGVVAAKGYTNDDVDGFTGSKDKNVIIGTEIRNIAAVAGEKLTVKNGLHVEADMPVYPVGYTVALNARLKRWNASTCKTEILKVARFKMPLVAVMPDQYKVSDKISDRLIFEADLEAGSGALSDYNDFEIQVAWEKSCKTMQTNMAGRIHDISLSFDRAAK